MHTVLCPLIAAIDSNFVQAVEHLFKTCVDTFGPFGTVAIAFAVYIAAMGRRIYLTYTKDKEVNLALKEKERTIQRLTAEAREYKIVIFKEIHKWSDHEIERFIVKNDLANAVEARKALEGEHSSGNGNTKHPKKEAAK